MVRTALFYSLITVGLLYAPALTRADDACTACQSGSSCSKGSCNKSACSSCRAGCRLRISDCGPKCQPYETRSPDLFYNFYAPKTACGGATAGMYIAPLPVPAFVGHTYYTYQPLLPHEFLYQHKRSYHSYNDGGRGFNRTSVKWYAPPVRTALSNTLHHFSFAR